MVDDMANIKPLAEHVNIQDLHAQLPAYLAAAARPPPRELGDVDAYSEAVLQFWRSSTSEASMPAWRLAA